MKNVGYSFKTALKNMWIEKWINLLTILSIGIGLSIFCLFVMMSVKMDSVLEKWTRSFGVIVYLDEEISSQEEDVLKEHFLQDPDIMEIKYVSKEQALEEVRENLGDNAIVLDVFQENPLPSSFELRLKKELLQTSFVKQKAAKLKQMSGVEEVQYGEKWLSSLNTISKTLRIGTIFFGGAIFIAISFMTYSTIKIFFTRRKEDIETLKMLGAPSHFIRLPFLFEGLIVGALGGLVSTIAIFGVYSFAALQIIAFLPSVSLFMTSLPLAAYVLIPFAGAFMSFTGSIIAVGKIRY
jgi:cell division transport system permease protein